MFFTSFIEPVWFTFKSANWPTVPCVIVHQRGSSSQRRVRYRYAVNGRTYLGSRLRSSGGIGKMRSWKREFYEGKQTTCRVNPNNPNEATLTWGASWTVLIGAVMGYAVWISVPLQLKELAAQEKSRHS